TMRWTSGLFVVIALAICCMMIVLTGLRGRDDQTALTFAIGDTRSITRGATAFGAVSRRRRSSGYSGVSLPKTTRERTRSIGMPFDGVDLHQRGVLALVATATALAAAVTAAAVLLRLLDAVLLGPRAGPSPGR
ncbi:hypothetical protein, partial [Brachybacterium sacelli]|uniref:hypothetical protein n=1 Tax=Brachybacterium sacelli TaxID=173364 RepID=UPI003612E136